MSLLTLQQVRAHPTPSGHATVWWLGQAGFILRSPGGVVLALDPYLSNSCKAIGDEHGFDMNRQVPPPIAPEELAGLDAYVMTHSHQDHCDPETLASSRAAGGRGPYVAPAETIEKLKSLGVPEEELRLVWPNREIVFGDVSLRTTFAIPFAGDDLTHVGYLITIQGGPKIYFTGDTGWHEMLAEVMLPHQPDALVCVINPAFRNLSPAEAALLAKRLNVKTVIPCHHDLFKDNCQPPQMLHTNLKLHGMGERYRLLQHGVAFDFGVPSAAV
jgi:L-ascorbate 6-phosphate lactonase